MSVTPLPAVDVDWKDLKTEARERFGVKRLRPGQREVIEAVLAGRDVIGIMPTGAGKSLCYQLPALFMEGTTVVVSPLLSLMQDQVEKLADAEVEAAKLDSTLTAREEEQTTREIRRGHHDLVYVTPERLENPEAVAALARTGVSLLVVDEAHCVSQWGHDFRPAYLALRDAAQRLGRPPILAVTATATPEVIGDLTRQLALRDPVVVNTGIDRPNLFLEVFRTVNLEAKQSRLEEIVREGAGRGGCGIVYTATVKAADEIWGWLQQRGFRAERYHAKLAARQRADIQRAFMAGDVDVIVATKAFGMGIDKPNIRFVVHWHFPDSPESYYQEAGRAGRDGQPARVSLLYQLEDKRIQSYFLGGKYPRAADCQDVFVALEGLLGQPVNANGVTMKDVVSAAALPERKTKVIVALLVAAGVLERGRRLRKRRGFASAAELEAFLTAYQQRHRSDQERLQAIMRYAEMTGCRMSFLRAYFGATSTEDRCGHCDNCQRTADSTAALASGSSAA